MSEKNREIPQGLENTIKQCEESLLHSDHIKNPEILKTLLADEFEEIGSAGFICCRQDVVDWLVNKGKDARWELKDFRVKILSDGLVLAIYHARKVGQAAAQSKGSLRSSIWKKTSASNGWQMIFHQATKIL